MHLTALFPVLFTAFALGRLVAAQIPTSVAELFAHLDSLGDLTAYAAAARSIVGTGGGTYFYDTVRKVPMTKSRIPHDMIYYHGGTHDILPRDTVMRKKSAISRGAGIMGQHMIFDKSVYST
jgi:hypothetical protein